MDKLTCSKETAQKLHDAGLRVETEFTWYKDVIDKDWKLGYVRAKSGHIRDKNTPPMSAPTLQEALELLPKHVDDYWLELIPSSKGNAWWINYTNGRHANLVSIDATTAVEAACLLLLHLAEEGIINLNELDL